MQDYKGLAGRSWSIAQALHSSVLVLVLQALSWSRFAIFCQDQDQPRAYHLQGYQ